MVGSNHENLSHEIFLTTNNNTLYNLRICKRNTAERGQNGSTAIPAAQGRFTGPKGLTFVRSTISNNRSCDPDHENILTRKFFPRKFPCSRTTIFDLLVYTSLLEWLYSYLLTSKQSKKALTDEENMKPACLYSKNLLSCCCSVTLLTKSICIYSCIDTYTYSYICTRN